jgi:drug/metabolite transporter (DMT)-like permease
VTEVRHNPKSLALVLLVVVTAGWGASFVVVKDAVAHMPVLSFLAWRFLIGGGLLAVARPLSLVRLGRTGWAQGVLLGLTLTAGYALQTFGLRYTSAAISGFLTGLQVLFTPLVLWVLLRQRPSARTWLATVFAVGGLAVMSLRSFSFGLGATLTVASAAVFALQIVGLGRWSTAKDAYGLAAVQLLTVGACCSLLSLPAGPHLPKGGGTWAAVLATAVVATAIAFLVQSWAQSLLSTVRAAIVFTLEPVFAALTAWFAGEPVGWSVVAGGSLVLVAMLIVEVTAWRGKTGARGDLLTYRDRGLVAETLHGP